MQRSLFVYNTLSKKKELFVPVNAPHVGMYVCGPTVYGDAHLGHARPAITFDLVFRTLKHLGYKVRYVRNITDVGHLENDADAGEDKVEKKARLDELEPMEVVQYYINRYHKSMDLLNVLPPSIEPLASGHIIEQQLMIKKIIENGFAYEKNGSVYFDVEKYNNQYHYGKLSGRVLDDLLSYTRELEGQSEKRKSYDFALWKKASPEHIMKWPSDWSVGFPGWHLECSVMSARYLGDRFDIHGGGMDLLFPHHECEIAQTVAATGHDAVKYWIHNNMITINGQKMGKSLGNFITLEEFFTGNHIHLEQAYRPMTIRFFILLAHYRSTLDFSNEALKAADKGLEKLLNASKKIQSLKVSSKNTVDLSSLEKNCYEALCDDFNSPVLISHLFEGVRIINSVNDGNEFINQENLDYLKKIFELFIENILGLKAETSSGNNQLTDSLIDFLLQLRIKAKANKDFQTSDAIRNELNKLGVEVKDTKIGFEWKII